MAAEAMLVANQCPNVCLDTSWTGGFLVQQFARAIGAERVLLAGDHADSCATELAKLRSCGLDSNELEWVLGRTAARIFGLSRAT